MNRREMLAGLGSIGVLGGAVATYAWRQTGESVDPVTVETLDAPGSIAGETAVPDSGRVTFLEVFATWCSTCRGMMPTLRKVHEQVDGQGSNVQFLSVSNEPIGTTVERRDIVDWWREYEGNWTVGIDADLALTAELDVRSVPTTFVFDRSNRLVQTGTSEKSAETLIEWIESAHTNDDNYD